MLRFEVGAQKSNQSVNTDAVLVDIPFGKHSIAKPDKTIDQKSQKGNTCWYYALGFLRPRYGKDFPDTFAKRRIEKIFSEHRKNSNKIEEQQTLANIFSQFINNGSPVDKCLAKKKISRSF